MDRRQVFFKIGTLAGQITYNNMPSLIRNQVNGNLNHEKLPFHTSGETKILKSNNASL